MSVGHLAASAGSDEGVAMVLRLVGVVGFVVSAMGLSIAWQRASYTGRPRPGWAWWLVPVFFGFNVVLIALRDEAWVRPVVVVEGVVIAGVLLATLLGWLREAAR